jgi:hypothetical protein
MTQRSVDAAGTVGAAKVGNAANPPAVQADAAEVTGIAAAAMTGASGATLEGNEWHAYWREHFREVPSLAAAARYEDVAPAFEYGRQRHGACCAGPGKARKGADKSSSFEAAETELARRWQGQSASAQLPWDMARDAVRAAWERIDQAMTSDEAKPGAR